MLETPLDPHQDYEDFIDRTRIELAGPNKPYHTSPSNTKPQHAIFILKFDDCSLDVIVRKNDLYLVGWFNKDNCVFLTKDSLVDVASLRKPTDMQMLSFSSHYGDLGFQQNQQCDTKFIDIPSISGVLDGLGKATKDSMKPNDSKYKDKILTLCLGVIEACRFDDVKNNIKTGKAIGKLDWDPPAKRADTVITKTA